MAAFGTALLGFSLLFVPQQPPQSAGEFRSTWSQSPDRIWAGSAFWANPIEDWRVHDGRLECVGEGANRNLHVLTRQVASRRGTLTMSVQLGRLDGGKGAGSAGFLLGVKSKLGDYRSALIKGSGLSAGITSAGVIFIGAPGSGSEAESLRSATAVELRLRAEPRGKRANVVLEAHDVKSGELLASVNKEVATDALSGNLALANNFLVVRGSGDQKRAGRKKNQGGVAKARYWFGQWKISGTRVDAHEDHAFGPILWAQHSLSRKVMKMTAQLPPVGDADGSDVQLSIETDQGWKEVQKSALDPVSRTASFRVPNWDDSRDIPYQLTYELGDRAGGSISYLFNGVVRRDPKEKRVVTVAGFTGNTDAGFPNDLLVRNVGIQDPDVLFFSGDQLYESVGGYGIKRTPVDVAVLTYLRKWYLFGWAFRDLLRDRPSIILPDDHDVYQGNIWGNGGNPITMSEHQRGGFAMHPDFVNVVMRTQCAHMPDPHDPTPIKQDIAVAYGDMVYGRISFAIIEDRKWKVGPKGLVDSGSKRPDHVSDRDMDVSKLDVPDAPLLGDRQLRFLRKWAADWRGADLKLVCSQTIFANVANYHGGGQQFLVADLDSNGWPQSGRNRALREIRRGFGLHFAGDQHLASIVQHGIDAHGDAGYSFCVPSIAAGYPRAWRPDEEGRPVKNRPASGLPNTGDYFDGFGNFITVHAVGNPAAKNRAGVLNTLHDKASGHGLLHFDKKTRDVRMECWRLQFDAENPEPGDQFPGWPKTVNMLENYGRKAVAWLPTIRIKGEENAIVQVHNEKTAEFLYALRISGTEFRPKVFDAEASYRVSVLGLFGATMVSSVRPGDGFLDIQLPK